MEQWTAMSSNFWADKRQSGLPGYFRWERDTFILLLVFVRASISRSCFENSKPYHFRLVSYFELIFFRYRNSLGNQINGYYTTDIRISLQLHYNIWYFNWKRLVIFDCTLSWASVNCSRTYYQMLCLWLVAEMHRMNLLVYRGIGQIQITHFRLAKLNRCRFSHTNQIMSRIVNCIGCEWNFQLPI